MCTYTTYLHINYFSFQRYTYEPASQLALDAYVQRITNPVRHVAKEVHRMSHYPEPARKYVGM